jgi:hypothetical protein
MRRCLQRIAFGVVLLAQGHGAAAQTSRPVPDPARKWEITDNSFLVEEAFNQESRVFQNIFTWTRNRGGSWDAGFTQEWPVPGMAHQLSYTIGLSRSGSGLGFGDTLLNYRYQLRTETAGGPAISPRVTLILPTGREADGFGSGTTGVQINVPASKQFGDFYLHANAGFTWLPDVERTPHVAGSGTWRVAPMINLMLEGVVDFDESFTLAPGIRGGWNFGDRQLVIGAAVPLTRADGGTTAAILTYVSYELPFSR